MYNKLIKLIVAGVMTLSFGLSVQAEVLTVSAGIPISYDLSNPDLADTTGEMSGTMLHFKFPTFVGLGYEDLTFKVDNSTNVGWNTKMVDIYYLFPIPVVNVTVGLGVGTNEPLSGLKSTYKTGTAAQGYLQLGFSFGVVDVHFSQHVVKSTLVKQAGGSLDTGGSMTAIGIQVGF